MLGCSDCSNARRGTWPKKLAVRTAHHLVLLETQMSSSFKTTSEMWNPHCTRNCSSWFLTMAFDPASCTHSSTIAKLRNMWPTLKDCSSVPDLWFKAPFCNPPVLNGWHEKPLIKTAGRGCKACNFLMVSLVLMSPWTTGTSGWISLYASVKGPDQSQAHTIFIPASLNPRAPTPIPLHSSTML